MATVEIEELALHWEALGQQDPLWAVLSVPEKRGGAWDLDEFLDTGQAELEEVLAELSERSIEVEHGRALDFGCGVGRLTRVLAEHFERCDGVDLARTMIEHATAVNSGLGGCRFHHNGATDLGLFEDGTFDFVLSLLVLQHMEPSLVEGYVREFVRVLRPGGIAYFNVPEHMILGSKLPWRAARADISLGSEITLLQPSEVLPLEVSVKNRSFRTWPKSAKIVLGNRWRASSGQLVVGNDARVPLDCALGARQSTTLSLPIVAPAKPGEYQLELDLVQEHRGWFADWGSAPMRVQVEVVPAGGTAQKDNPPQRAGSSEPFEPQVEMHMVARAKILAVVRQAGGVVLDVFPKERCGSEMLSLDYIVRRASSPAGPKAARRAGQRAARRALGRVTSRR